MKFNKTKYNTKTIISWLWRHHKGCRRQAILNMIVGLIQVTAGLVGVEFLRRLTDIATGKAEGTLLVMALIYVGLIVIEFLCNIFHTWIAAVLGVKTQNNMQQAFFSRLLNGKWNGIERFHSGDILNRLFGDVSDIVNLMTEVLPFIVTIVVQFIASFCYLLVMDAKLAYIIILVTPVFLILSRLYFRRMRRIVRKVKDSNSSLQAIIQESVQHKMVIKIMEMADNMVNQLEKRQSLLRWQIKTRAKFSILTRIIIFIGFRGSALVALIYCLFQLNSGIITVGVLMAFTQLIGRIQHPLLELGRLLPTFVNSFTSSERLIELEELPLENTDDKNRPNRETEQILNTSPAIGLRFTDVDYQYKPDTRKVFSGFSHDFRPGSFTAVLGETGAGKTTMLRLMLSLIDQQKGIIELYSGNGGNETKTDACFFTRRYFSYVPQGNTLFSGSIRENLRFGNPDATSEQMFDALHTAQADFVKELPNGLDTKCGEGGGGLSEGQAQRIAIARAILRPCKILLLDEATSALDIATEKKLLKSIKEKYADTTLIFITHRLSTVEFATEQITLERNEE